MQLYKSLVRPHLEYAVQAWRPYQQKLVDQIEKVQRRATQMIKGPIRIPYDQRLQRKNLNSLETRSQRADLVEVYKIMHGLED